ncbi:MAG TPA: protein translocase subunit SecD [Kofleriaceae bacterium]|jgi:preprotein translocase subunit SecD|nr:protein translocase subunit SecD [Kofleriaceae bacterium]
MDRSLKWRTIALMVGLLLCACLLAPSWPGSDVLPSWFPFQKKISLGLDLQGGVHIEYSIALDRAIDDKASEIKRDLEARFADDHIDAKIKLPAALGAVTVIPADAKKKAEIESQINTDYHDVTLPRACAPDDGPNAICFEVAQSYAEGIKKSALSNAINTIRERINASGVADPSVVEKGDNIIVELPGNPKDPAMQATRAIIAQTSKLEFKVVDNNSALMNAVFRKVGSTGKDEEPTDARAKQLEIKARYDAWTPEDRGSREQDFFLEAYDAKPGTTEQVTVDWVKKYQDCLNHPEIRDTAARTSKVACQLSGRGVMELYLFGDPKGNTPGIIGSAPDLKIPDDRQISFEPVYPDQGAVDTRVKWRSYYLDRAVKLTGSAISNAQPSNDPNTGRPVVLLDYNRFGGRVFGDLTAQIVGKKLAFILDDKVRSAPVINTAIRGGRTLITLGGGDVQRQEHERDELVNVLRTGSLPAPLVKQSESELGPTLGRDAIDKTKLSFELGIVLVVLIMVGVYRWSGWIAVFAVVFHIVMTLAVMAMFGATLTLPGIAAIVLSIGMEVDGNILIYERIRDELLLGKSVRGAIDLGFSRAFSAILDGQLTTAAAGWVLLQYGSGPIKGFAVMLLVGVFTTLSTNIWVTRIFFDWYVSRKKGQLATISI